MARPAKPTVLKLLSGDPKSRINFDEPQPEIGIPHCPSADPLVRDIWDYTAKVLKQMGVLTIADRDMLYAYCQTVATFERACEVLDREGPFTKILNSTQPHPAIKVQKEAAALMKNIASEFGLTPASRTRIKLADSKDVKPSKDMTSARLLSG
jgi:P27 family predicted phage terminase small subunit